MSKYKTGCELPTHVVKQSGVRWAWYASKQKWIGTPCIEDHYDLTKRAVRESAAAGGTSWSAKALQILQQLVGNGTWGCCVIACYIKNLLTTLVNESGTLVIPNDNDGEVNYETCCGYVPNKASTYQGCVPEVVAGDMQTTGLLIQGKEYLIDGWASIDPTRPDILEAACQDFGGIGLTMALPDSWDAAAENNGFILTQPPATAKVLGGHMTYVPDWLTAGTTPPLFSSPVPADGGFINLWPFMGFVSSQVIANGTVEGVKIINGAYVILPQDWYAKGGISASGLNVDSLKAVLADLKGGKIPPPPNPVPPTPTPTPTHPRTQPRTRPPIRHSTRPPRSSLR